MFVLVEASREKAHAPEKMNYSLGLHTVQTKFEEPSVINLLSLKDPNAPPTVFCCFCSQQVGAPNVERHMNLKHYHAYAPWRVDPAGLRCRPPCVKLVRRDSKEYQEMVQRQNGHANRMAVRMRMSATVRANEKEEKDKPAEEAEYGEPSPWEQEGRECGKNYNDDNNDCDTDDDADDWIVSSTLSAGNAISAGI